MIRSVITVILISPSSFSKFSGGYNPCIEIIEQPRFRSYTYVKDRQVLLFSLNIYVPTLTYSEPKKPIQTLLPAFLTHVHSVSHSIPTPHTLFHTQADFLLVSGAHHNFFFTWIVGNEISILKTLSDSHVTLQSSVAPLPHVPSRNAGRCVFFPSTLTACWTHIIAQFTTPSLRDTTRLSS